MRCGAEVSKDATFCSCCGQKFESADDTRGRVWEHRKMMQTTRLKAEILSLFFKKQCLF